MDGEPPSIFNVPKKQVDKTFSEILFPCFPNLFPSPKKPPPFVYSMPFLKGGNVTPNQPTPYAVSLPDRGWVHLRLLSAMDAYRIAFRGQGLHRGQQKGRDPRRVGCVCLCLEEFWIELQKYNQIGTQQNKIDLAHYFVLKHFSIQYQSKLRHPNISREFLGVPHWQFGGHTIYVSFIAHILWRQATTFPWNPGWPP